MSIIDKLFGKKEKNKTACEYAISGEYLSFNGKNKEALKEFNKALELEPDNDMVYALRSKTYKNMEKYKEALEDIDKALSIQPDVNVYRKLKRQIMVFID